MALKGGCSFFGSLLLIFALILTILPDAYKTAEVLLPQHG